MANSSLRTSCGGLIGLCLILQSTASWADQADPFKEQITLIATGELPSEASAHAAPLTSEKPESFFQFLSERTQIGYGWDSTFNDNIFLEDNRRVEDYINTLEGVLFFNDARGGLLYGSQWEVNAFRYMHSNRNAINHDVVTYIDYDPGGRLQFHFTHMLDIANRLVFGAPGVDILRRSKDFQRSVEHSFEQRLRYALTEDNGLVGRTSYSLFDDQAVNDASTDRKLFKASLDLDHSVTRTWTVFGGALFEDRYVPGDKLKSSTSYGGRLGARYELSPTERFDALLEIKRPKGKERKVATDPDYSIGWSHELGPRTLLRLDLKDSRVTSFSSGRTDFRARVPSFKVQHELTPLIEVNFGGLYEKQKSSSKSTTDSSGTSEVNKLWGASLGLVWQIREQVHITFDYVHRRSTTRDYTNNDATLGMEGTF